MIEPVPFTAVAATLLVSLFLAPTTSGQDAAHLEPEKRAIAAIERLLHLKSFPRLASLTLVGTEITDAGLVQFKDLMQKTLTKTRIYLSYSISLHPSLPRRMRHACRRSDDSTSRGLYGPRNFGPLK
jgi:hypothetical protein